MFYVHAHWLRRDGAQFTTYTQTNRERVCRADHDYAETALQKAFPDTWDAWRLMALEVHPNKP